MHTLKAVLFACITISLLAPGAGAQSWKMIKNDHGIKVWERDVKGTDLREYVGVTVIDEKMEVLGEILRDVPSYRLWLPDCETAKILRYYDRNTMAIHMVLDPPVIQKREIVLKNRTLYDWDYARGVITFSVTDEVKVPFEGRRVRIPLMDGSFEMEYMGRDRTKFVYRLKVDPGGDIPKMVAYSVMRNYPYLTLRNLKKIKSTKYLQAAKGTEEERAIVTRTKNEEYVRNLLFRRLTKFVYDKKKFHEIIKTDRRHIKEIVNSGGSYQSVENASVRIFTHYLEGTISNRSTFERLRNNKGMFGEIIEMVSSECGTGIRGIESIVRKYE